MAEVSDVIASIRQFSNSQVGYRFWGGGALEKYSPMWTGHDYSTEDVWADPYANCSGIINVGRHLTLGSACFKSGTKGYGDWIKPWEKFKPYKSYPVGTLLVQPYIHGVSEGHIAIVSTHEQKILQSTSWYGGWYPGVTEDKTVMQQHEWTPWTWAGFMPDCLPREYKKPVRNISSYPGDTATIRETALWMAHVAEEEYGLPGILPVMCSCVELTCGWLGEGDVKNCPGYLYAVDHDSLGWFQQRPSQGWGTVEQIKDPDYSLRKFLEEAKKLEGQYDHSAAGLGAWCQAVQRSAYPDAYAKKGYPMAKRILDSAGPVEPAPKEFDVVWSKYNLVAKFGTSSSDFINAALASLENSGIQAASFNDADNIATCSRGALTMNNVEKMNCLVVGKEALEHLVDQAKPAWEKKNPIWGLYGDTDVVTLKRLRDWALEWIAKEEGVDASVVKSKFENVLLGLDRDYADMLAQVDDHEFDDPPDNRTLEERVTALEQDVAKLKERS